MARIRTIKPEMWASEQIGDCSRNARLLFIGLLNFCDDNGVHPASPRRLKAEVFPHDADVSPELITAWLDEIKSSGLTASYKVNGEQYILVTGWERHQKIEKPTYRHPLPDGSTGKISATIRRHVAENCAINSLHVIDLSTHPLPRNGMESNGVPPPCHGDDYPTLVNCIQGKIPSGINSADCSEIKQGGDDEF